MEFTVNKAQQQNFELTGLDGTHSVSPPFELQRGLMTS